MSRQGGFSLLEMVIAVSLVAMIGVLLLANFGPWVSFYQEMETDRRLKQLLVAVTTAYEQNAYAINDMQDAVLQLDQTLVLNPTTRDDSGHCQADASTLAPLAAYTGQAGEDVWHDGYGNPLCVFISPALALQPALPVASGQADTGQAVSPVTVWYHIIAFVSPGADGHLDPDTTWDDQGHLVLKGDDRGVVLNGYGISQGKLDMTVQRMTRLAKAYEVYFKARYAVVQQVAVDYFANGNRQHQANAAQWDSSGAMNNTGGEMQPVNVANGAAMTPLQVLGLAPADGVDAYGAIIGMDNSSDAVRSPDNSNSALQAAPFTARFVTTLPGGDPFSISAVGTY